MGDVRAVTVVLEPSPTAAITARRALLTLIGDIGPVVFVRDAILLSSELVSNAVQHASGPYRFQVECSDTVLRVEVRDESTHLPTVPIRAPEREGGFGLGILNDLASRWGTLVAGHGKSVWFELDIERTQHPEW